MHLTVDVLPVFIILDLCIQILSQGLFDVEFAQELGGAQVMQAEALHGQGCSWD